jgi:hypothetical protein
MAASCPHILVGVINLILERNTVIIGYCSYLLINLPFDRLQASGPQTKLFAYFYVGPKSMFFVFFSVS